MFPCLGDPYCSAWSAWSASALVPGSSQVALHPTVRQGLALAGGLVSFPVTGRTSLSPTARALRPLGSLLRSDFGLGLGRAPESPSAWGVEEAPRLRLRSPLGYPRSGGPISKIAGGAPIVAPTQHSPEGREATPSWSRLTPCPSIVFFRESASRTKASRQALAIVRDKTKKKRSSLQSCSRPGPPLTDPSTTGRKTLSGFAVGILRQEHLHQFEQLLLLTPWKM